MHEKREIESLCGAISYNLSLDTHTHTNSHTNISRHTMKQLFYCVAKGFSQLKIEPQAERRKGAAANDKEQIFVFKEKGLH